MPLKNAKTDGRKTPRTGAMETFRWDLVGDDVMRMATQQQERKRQGIKGRAANNVKTNKIKLLQQ